MQTGSSGTLIGWKSGQTTFVPLWDRMEGAWLRTLCSRTCHSRLSEQFLESQAAFGTTFRQSLAAPDTDSRDKLPEEGDWQDFQN